MTFVHTEILPFTTFDGLSSYVRLPRVRLEPSYISLDGGAGLTELEFQQRICLKTARFLQELHHDRRCVGRAHYSFFGINRAEAYVDRTFYGDELFTLSSYPVNFSCQRLRNRPYPVSLLETMMSVYDFQFQLITGLAMMSAQKDLNALTHLELEEATEKLSTYFKQDKLDLGVDILVMQGTQPVGPRVGKREHLTLRSSFKPQAWRRLEHTDGVLWIGSYISDPPVSYTLKRVATKEIAQPGTYLHCPSFRRLS